MVEGEGFEGFVVEAKLSQLCCGQSPVLDFPSLGLLLIQIPSWGSQDTQDGMCHCPLARSSAEPARTSLWDAETPRSIPTPPKEQQQAKPTGFLLPGAPGAPLSPLSPPSQPVPALPLGTALQPRLQSRIDGGALQSQGEKK